MKVNECMCKPVQWVKPETTVCDCANLMAQYKIGFVPVCTDEKNVVGIITDRDILLRSVCCDKDAKTTPISEIMTTEICYCDANEELEKAEHIMSDNQIRRLPIVENNKIVGILSIGDISRNPNTTKKEFTQTIDNICKCGNKHHQ